MKGSITYQAFVDRKDERSGRTVRQLTSAAGNHHHLYFTSSSFTQGNDHVLFLSDSGGGSPNVFKLSLKDGQTVQLTDNRKGIMKSYVYYDGTPYEGLAKASPSYHPGTDSLLYIQDQEVRLIHLPTMEDRVVHRLPEGVMTGFTHISGDGEYACVPYISADAFDVGEGNPFTLIRDKVQAGRTESHVLVIHLPTGRSEIKFRHAGWITHVQFHPDDSEQILFNHEGGMVAQRIWLYKDGVVSKIRDQSAGGDRLWICHEMWDSDGSGVIYHGTRGVPNDPSMRHASVNGSIQSFVGYAGRRQGEEIEMSFPDGMKDYGHFTLGSDRTMLLTDGIIDAESLHCCRADWESGRLEWDYICRHGSSFSVQDVHPHPIFSHDDRLVLFTSDTHNERSKGNLYLVDLGEEQSEAGNA
ncbi:hypothetical protein SK3146_01410 [Paenibacillus konkukensis]|uniref:Oligogalacturonate lyase domain-containing protein n=1 Tax=Paenibacillus konkukensis TaxID=2020716 RepID=A0ABY4RJF0_9BACL|nr:oligogalacturonate lyase family protein [Paenibacillus konkukensis]UQZ82253.1 hypothetical protein SK3146_01410 [Paenibacillus konkukensis]